MVSYIKVIIYATLFIPTSQPQSQYITCSERNSIYSITLQFTLLLQQNTSNAYYNTSNNQIHRLLVTKEMG